MTFQIDVRQLIHSLSEALDLVGIDEVQHGKRVAFMACECAKAMNFSATEHDRLYHGALLHDCGVSSTQVHKKLVTELDWSDSHHHCSRGEELLKRSHLFAGLPTIIRWHHTHWEDMPKELDRTTALISNLIYLTDRVDALIAQQENKQILIARHSICETINRYRGSFFEAGLVDCFLTVAGSELFWLSLEPRHLVRYIAEMEVIARPRIAERKDILQIAAIFADIVDAKSKFTVEHSRGVARLARYLGVLVGIDQDVLDMLEAASLLHDLGKLNIPDEILEKPGPLTEEERAVMMRHSFESYQLLRRIDGFEEIAQWAAFHHETLSGSGYPFHRDRDRLSVEARIIAVADVFQALAQDRPYRASLPSGKILVILEDMVAEGNLDRSLVKLVKDNHEACWRQATGLDS